MNAWEIDRLIPRAHPCGYVVPRHFHVVLEHRRSCFGDPPGLWIDMQHERNRWACFCLIWAAIGAQRALDGLP